MKKIKWVLNNIEAIITVTLIMVMMILLFLQVVFRSFGLPLAWTEELSMFLMVWLCYFGASMAIIYRRHMKVDIIVSHFSLRTQLILDIVANVAFALFAVIVIKENSTLMMRFFNGNQLAAATRIPKWIAYAGIPTAFFLMLIRLIQDTVKRVKEFIDVGNAPVEEQKNDKGGEA